MLEAIDVDHHHGGPDQAVIFGKAEYRFETIEKQLPIRQAGEVVMYGVVQQPFLGRLDVGDVT